jgi:hypothetical protein
VVAVHLDAGIVRGGRAAEEERFVAFTEDEEVGDTVLERLGSERAGPGDEVARHPTLRTAVRGAMDRG